MKPAELQKLFPEYDIYVEEDLPLAIKVRIVAAVKAYNLGIGTDYALKRYGKEWERLLKAQE